MSSDRSSSPARTLTLLWRQPQTTPSVRGRKPTLTLDQIVAAASKLADAEGVEALTMRSAAQALKVTPMSLYTYVPGKAELLELMLDDAYAKMSRIAPCSAHWRERLTAIADDNLALYARHPWIASCSISRPPLGPGVMSKYEYELRAFDGLGLEDVEIDASLTLVLEFVRSCARAEAEAKASAQESAMSDPQWWAANAPLLARVFDSAKYPTAARVGAAAGAAYGGAYSAAHAYQFGLKRILDGLGVLLAARATLSQNNTPKEDDPQGL